MFYKLKGNQKKKESKKKRHNKIKVFVPKTSKILKVAAASPRKKKFFLTNKTNKLTALHLELAFVTEIGKKIRTRNLRNYKLLLLLNIHTNVCV